MAQPIRIANCSGFYGDRLSAAREMVEGGPIDILTGDYLAELTMAILWRDRRKDPDGGYARTFARQMEEVMAACLERGIRVVSNAGGLNPAGLTRALREIADRQGLSPRIATITGDDLLDRLSQLGPLTDLDTGVPLGEITPLTANAYLGGWGIAAALDRNADVVVTGRVTDAALVIGPAAHHHRWAPDDWDALAGALVAGHVIECGAQTTGGNFSFFEQVPGLDHIGFPLVEMEEDGSFVVTKHPGTGGLVDVETVTAQLLYEIGGPRYHNPDVTARFDTIRLVPDGADRVRVEGVKGEPPPATTKVAINHLGGYRNSVTFVLTGLDIPAKAAAVEQALWSAVGGRESFAQTDVRFTSAARPDPATSEEAMADLRITVKDPDQAKVGRDFTRAAVELALAHYPGFFLTSPPTDATPYAVYRPVVIPSAMVRHHVEIDGETLTVDPTPGVDPEPLPAPSPPEPHPVTATVEGPLGHVVGGRSGDKGGNANLGVWTATTDGYRWLAGFLDVDRLRRLLPETTGLEIERHLLPNLRAVNFVIRGLLGEGVASSVRTDAQAKALAEHLRARMVELPVDLIRRRYRNAYHLE